MYLLDTTHVIMKLIVLYAILEIHSKKNTTPLKVYNITISHWVAVDQK